MAIEDDPWSEARLQRTLMDLDENLAQARRHPNDRDARRMLSFGLRTIAELKLPIGLGLDIDQLLIKPIAASTLLQKAIRLAERKLYDDQEEVAAVSKCIERLREVLIPLSERLSGVEPEDDYI
jgi:hypothetical protein